MGKSTKTLKKAIEITYQLINDIIFICEIRMKSSYFTRTGKMNFKNIILFMLNLVKKSLQLELDVFLEKVVGEGSSITKQAYSEARKKFHLMHL